MCKYKNYTKKYRCWKKNIKKYIHWKFFFLYTIFFIYMNIYDIHLYTLECIFIFYFSNEPTKKLVKKIKNSWNFAVGRIWFFSHPFVWQTPSAYNFLCIVLFFVPPGVLSSIVQKKHCGEQLWMFLVFFSFLLVNLVSGMN